MSARSNRSHLGNIGSADAKLRAAMTGMADWLCLAAAPTFAVMALMTGLSHNPNMLCMGDISPFGGMVPMYLLMSAFHLAPWFDLLSGQRTLRRQR